MRLLPTPHLFQAHLAQPGGSDSPPPPPSIPSGPRLTFIRFRPAHTSASFPAGSRARFKRPRAASNAATLSILLEHSCSLSPCFRPVPRGLSARVRRRMRLPSAHFWAPPISSFSFTRYLLRMALLTFRASCIPFITLVSLLAFSGHFVICFPCSVHFPGGFRSP